MRRVVLAAIIAALVVPAAGEAAESTTVIACSGGATCTRQQLPLPSGGSTVVTAFETGAGAISLAPCLLQLEDAELPDGELAFCESDPDLRRSTPIRIRLGDDVFAVHHHSRTSGRPGDSREQLLVLSVNGQESGAGVAFASFPDP